MRVRVVRSVAVKPEMFQDFCQISLQAAKHVEDHTKIRPGVFWVRYGTSSNTDMKIFMDFDSLAQYEQLFLHGLLYDATYLTLAEQTVAMIKQEPSDALLVLMDKDDFFMNLKDQSKQSPANLPRSALVPRRYRLSRHIDVTAGKLRDFMKYAFDFMDQFERVAGFRPELFCTRFTAERIGCTNMFFDFDDCPMCGPALLQFNQSLARDLPGVIDAVQPDELCVEITNRDATFDLRAAMGPTS